MLRRGARSTCDHLAEIANGLAGAFGVVVYGITTNRQDAGAWSQGPTAIRTLPQAQPTDPKAKNRLHRLLIAHLPAQGGKHSVGTLEMRECLALPAEAQLMLCDIQLRAVAGNWRSVCWQLHQPVARSFRRATALPVVLGVCLPSDPREHLDHALMGWLRLDSGRVCLCCGPILREGVVCRCRLARAITPHYRGQNKQQPRHQDEKTQKGAPPTGRAPRPFRWCHGTENTGTPTCYPLRTRRESSKPGRIATS